MKKIFYYSLAVVALFSCHKANESHPSKSGGDEDFASFSSKGYLVCGLNADSYVKVQTKAAVSADNLKNYTIYGSGPSINAVLDTMSKPYSEDGLIYDTAVVKPGFYKVCAQNITGSESQTLNDGKGEKWIYGCDTTTVFVNKTSVVEVKCSVINAGVQVIFDTSYLRIFDGTVSNLEIDTKDRDSYTARNIKLTKAENAAEGADDTLGIYYFPVVGAVKADSTVDYSVDNELTYTLKAENLLKQKKSYSGKFKIKPGYLTRLIFKATADRGLLIVKISAEDEFIGNSDQEATFDPYDEPEEGEDEIIIEFEHVE